MFSCFCAYKLSWLYPLAETVDLHVPKYRKHRWHARSMSEAVFYFAFSAQTCLHYMKTRFFQLFTIEIFWYLFQTSFFARIPHKLYLNPFNCNSELSIPIYLYGNGELVVKWASPLWRLLVNHDRRRIRSCCHPVNSLSSVSSSSVFCGDSTTYLYMSFVFYADNTISTWVLCLVLTALSLHNRYILCWQHYLYMSSVVFFSADSTISTWALCFSVDSTIST